MLGKFRTLRTGFFAAALAAGALFVTPTSSFAAERGHNAVHDRGRVVQHFDRGRQIVRGHIRGFDRGRGLAGSVVVRPAPEYVPVSEYGYYAAAPGYTIPVPECNAASYGY